jgi:hypothetical protein
MRLMTRLAAAIALVFLLTGAEALVPCMAQHVGPGGGIGNSTGIGSGLGGIIGTGPTYPNGTTQPTLPTPPPPGGYGGLRTSPPPATLIEPHSHYPQPREPFDAAMQRPPTAWLSIPEQQTGDLSFLKGCWRSDVFQYAKHPGTSTWCFDDKGTGRFLFTRQDETDYYCSGPAQAGYAGQVLRLHDTNTACTDRSDKGPGDFHCHPNGEAAQCTGAGSAAIVHMLRIR